MAKGWNEYLTMVPTTRTPHWRTQIGAEGKDPPNFGRWEEIWRDQRDSEGIADALTMKAVQGWGTNWLGDYVRTHGGGNLGKGIIDKLKNEPKGGPGNLAYNPIMFMQSLPGALAVSYTHLKLPTTPYE